MRLRFLPANPSSSNSRVSNLQNDISFFFCCAVALIACRHFQRIKQDTHRNCLQLAFRNTYTHVAICLPNTKAHKTYHMMLHTQSIAADIVLTAAPHHSRGKVCFDELSRKVCQTRVRHITCCVCGKSVYVVQNEKKS